jgi:glucose uptake protein
MILPQTFNAALFLLILGLVCLGSWASAYKLAGKLRYELFYVDFALGAAVLALIYALTVGSLGVNLDGLSFADDLSNAGKRQWLYGFIAGVIFNFGNMLLMSSVSVSGMAVAFPTAFSMALIVSTLVNMLGGGPAGNTTLLLAGCGLLIPVIVVGAMSANMLGVLRHEAMAKAGTAKSTRRPSSMKGVVLGIVGGLLLGGYAPLLDKARESDIGMGPYAAMVVFTLGLFFSTLVFSVFFFNLPVEGDPVGVGDYLKLRPLVHGKGLLAGAIWCTGALALWVTAQTPNLLRDSRTLTFSLSQGAPLLAALWGLVVWREFRGGDVRVKTLSVLMLVLLACALALLAMAAVHVPNPT